MTDTSAHVRVTPTHLADGRELFYFDDSEPYVSGGATRRLDDPRPLPDRFAPDEQGNRVTGPELRRDPLTGEWIPMAAHRMNRTVLPPAGASGLASAKPGARYQDGEIPAEDYDVVVFENRFPSLMRVPGATDEVNLLDDEELWQMRPAAGRTVQSGSPSRCTGASGIPGIASSDGKRFSKTTTS